MNDSDDEHPNVKFGMPLELYDENNLPSKQSSLPIHEQIVTDEEGRRRFHGAFTGGFSAGYYNTVGSKDGWTPSTFISSRKDKSKKKQSKPEDYMDEEDMGEYGIATKTIKAKQTFTSTRKRDLHEEKLVKEHKENSTLFLGTQLLDSLVIPTKTSIGIKLLKKLGWKEGQGIGARVDAKKPLTGKVYGCQLPTNKEDNLFYENVSFAPKDVVPMPMTGKDDVHGIGYSGLDPTAALRGNIERSTAVQLHTKSGIKMSFKGQAFGVGAFEADDDDIYAVDCMDNYDIEMGEEKNPDNTYGWTKPLALTGGSRRDAITNRVVKEVRGFVAARMKKLLNRVVYPPPNLPPDFDPHRRLKLHQQKIRIDNLQLQPSATGSVVGSIDEVGTKQLDANARRELLGDEMSVTSKSVFEFMSREDRERLQRLKDPKPPQPDVPQPTVPQPAVPQPTGSKTSTEKAPTLPSLPPVDPLKPMCDVSKLRPFADDPAKQRRYEEFERAIRRRNKDPYRGIVSTLTEWEKNQERQDFSRAAQVYLHLNNNFNSKFEKAKSSDDDKLEGSKRREARVFGALTREKIEWHPDPLLCKRFNVPDPYPDSDLVGVEPVSIFSSLREIERGFTKDLQTLREVGVMTSLPLCIFIVHRKLKLILLLLLHLRKTHHQLMKILKRRKKIKRKKRKDLQWISSNRSLLHLKMKKVQVMKKLKKKLI